MLKRRVVPNATFFEKLTRLKPASKGIAEATDVRTYRWWDLVMYGMAATVGSGIFVVVGEVAHDYTGPAVIFSTLIAGCLAMLTGICYLEFASAFPVSGSAYAYCYTVLGEIFAWMMGWNLTLEYAFSASYLAGNCVQGIVDLVSSQGSGVQVPLFLYNIPILNTSEGESILRINILAALICALVGAFVLVSGKVGRIGTNLISALNFSLILFIIFTGMTKVNTANYSPFFHFKEKAFEGKTLQEIFKGKTLREIIFVIIPSIFQGIFQGSSHMFFAYIGYDTISSLAGEAVNPAVDLPIAVIVTVIVATLLYIAVGLVICGMVPYGRLDKDVPLMDAFRQVNMNWVSVVVGIGSLMCMIATILACLIGQPKIFEAMSKDGLLPKSIFVRQIRGRPVLGIVASTILTMAIVLFVDVKKVLLDMITFGTLLGMAVICLGLIYMRLEQNSKVKSSGTVALLCLFFGTFLSSIFLANGPGHLRTVVGLAVAVLMVLTPIICLCVIFVRNRASLASKSSTFSCPLVPLLPCFAAVFNIFIICQTENLLLCVSLFMGWTLIGLLIYFAYGIRYSNLIYEDDEEKPQPADSKSI